MYDNTSSDKPKLEEIKAITTKITYERIMGVSFNENGKMNFFLWY